MAVTIKNYDFGDLHIEHEQNVFTKQPIYNLTKNIVEMLNISSIKLYFDNRIYESNPQNSNFDDLRFDGDERLIARR